MLYVSFHIHIRPKGVHVKHFFVCTLNNQRKFALGGDYPLRQLCGQVAKGGGTNLLIKLSKLTADGNTSVAQGFVKRR